MFFDIFGFNDINKGVEEFRQTKNAVLLDVRTKEEYAGCHIPDSINLPLDELEEIDEKIPERDTAIFVHCLSGARSAEAERRLEQKGYTKVKNIGGINSYRGETV